MDNTEFEFMHLCNLDIGESGFVNHWINYKIIHR